METLEKWQKEFLKDSEGVSMMNHRKEGKSYFQAYEFVEFMKSAEIGKKVSIISPEGCSTWEKIK